jgi:ABC-type nitrate/sulfonate/bicarbonate transport system permease component
VIVALTLQGLIMYYAVEILEKFLIPWHVSRRAGPEQATL